MTLPEILSNETLRQREFPVAQQSIYLAHAGVSPLPRRVAEAIHQYATECTGGDQETGPAATRIHETRVLAARLLRARPEEIALVGPTSLGLSLVAAGIKTAPGQNVLIYFDDYPSNVYPWMALAERGVDVRFLPVREFGCIRVEDVLAQVDGQTRLVALASAHFLSGWRPDLATLGRELRERGILFCVDGIQTLGAFPTTVEHVDFLAADAHKWLLGPCGAGILYVRRELQEQLRPFALGWHNVRCPGFAAQAAIEFQPDARRYEAGTHNLLGVVGLHAALRLIEELGVESTAAELTAKRRRLVGALQSRGYSVLNPEPPPGRESGITSAWREGADLAPVQARLAEARILVSLRTDRAGRNYLRFSPHAYNTDAELDRALALL